MSDENVQGNLRRYEREVYSRLRTFPGRKSDPGILQNIYNSELEILGLTVPQQRDAYAYGYSFLASDERELIQIFDYIWRHSKVFEVKGQVLLFFEDKKHRSLCRKHWGTLKNWAKHVDNWAHSDMLSKIYADILEYSPERVFPVYEIWNNATNPWLRRQSVVGLLYYTNSRSVYPPFRHMVTLIANLFDDQDYYVQRGVGWAIRELEKAYPYQAWNFLSRYFHKLSATAYAIASEKLPPQKKEKLKRWRKRARQDKNFVPPKSEVE